MKLFAVLALSAVMMVGCPSSKYHDAVIAEHDFKLAVASFQQAEIQEHTAGRIDDAEHQKIEAAIEKVGNAGQTLVTSLQGGVANTTVQQNFATVGVALNNLLDTGVLGIKNANSQALLKTLIQTIKAILDNVGSLLAAPTTSTVKAGN